MISNPLPLSIRQSKFWRVVRRVLWPIFPGWVDEGRRIVQGPRLQSLIRKAQDASPPLRRLLNAGAGEGLFSYLLLGVQEAELITEVDVSYPSRSRRAADQRQQIVGASLTSIPLADSSVDFILCSEVLEHIVEDGQALDELKRVLAPRGWLLISVPTPPAVFDPAHVREGYTANELSSMLAIRGLQVVETRFCMYALFQIILRTCRDNRRTPKGFVRGLALLDRVCQIGSPMDLIILCRVCDHEATS